MCYLKKFETFSAIPPSKSLIVEDTDDYSSEQSTFFEKKNDNFFDINKSQISQTKNARQSLFIDMVSKLNYNSTLMNSLELKITKNDEMLDELLTQLNQKTQKVNEANLIQTQNDSNQESSQKIGHFADEEITQKLFGKKSYKYKLKLTQNFSDVIYKERNISFSISLTNTEGQIVRNSNIIHLCLGVSNANGQWISQTKNGDNFMKGKTETQLYHGQGNYSKIYPRDVSRGYQNGKVNFVIYPKPSMIHYSGNTSSLESKVNYEQIQPLVIKDLTIRAKKKVEE